MLWLEEVPRQTRKTLEKVARRARDGVARTRARVIVSMLRFQNIPRAAREAGVSESYARRVVRDFRERKLEALPPKHGGGRPRAVSEDQAKALADLVRTPPTVLNLPWTQWSLSKIHLYATKAGIIPKISLETLRTTLIRNEITYQRTKTWKMSNDPQFQEKFARVQALYKQCPEDGVVVCVDEFGPLELRPYAGRSWAPQKQPQRLPATFHRPYGTRHFLAWYDVHADYLGGWFYRRKRGEEFLDFLQRLRSCYPSWQRIYAVLDNFSPHLRQDVQEWAAANNVELVFIATNASWMNRIECHFAPLRKFALEGSFPRTHRDLQRAIRRYLHWRNADPKDPRILKIQKRVKVA